MRVLFGEHKTSICKLKMRGRKSHRYYINREYIWKYKQIIMKLSTSWHSLGNTWHGSNYRVILIIVFFKDIIFKLIWRVTKKYMKEFSNRPSLTRLQFFSRTSDLFPSRYRGKEVDYLKGMGILIIRLRMMSKSFIITHFFCTYLQISFKSVINGILSFLTYVLITRNMWKENE